MHDKKELWLYIMTLGQSKILIIFSLLINNIILIEPVPDFALNKSLIL